MDVRCGAGVEMRWRCTEREVWAVRWRQWIGSVEGPHISLADSSSLLHANHSPLCTFQAIFDTALEGAASALSNAGSTSIQKPRSGEGLTF